MTTKSGSVKVKDLTEKPRELALRSFLESFDQCDRVLESLDRRDQESDDKDGAEHAPKYKSRTVAVGLPCRDECLPCDSRLGETATAEEKALSSVGALRGNDQMSSNERKEVIVKALQYCIDSQRSDAEYMLLKFENMTRILNGPCASDTESLCNTVEP